MKTPQIDSIAANGARCTAGYVTAPQCCPSRAGLITGRYQNRFGFEVNFPAELYLQGRVGLPPGEATIADRLKAAGYATGIVGKWHLGDTVPMRPCQRGFTEAFWHPNGGVLFPDAKTGFIHNLWRNNERVQSAEYSTDAFGCEAARFIEQHQHEPFFLYLSFVAPHWPMEAKPEHLAQFAHVPDLHRRTFLAMMASLDENVGRVLAKLRETKLEENTLVFFLSDNGGPTGPTRARSDAPFQYGANTSRNAPCRGEKGDLLEGGIRVPFLVQWQGRIPAGKVYDRPVISLDVASTALGAAGVKPGPDGELDGTNLLPYLSGDKQGDPHDVLCWRFLFPSDQPAYHRWAVRRGDWKLVKNAAEPLSLYDLAADVGETRNLASQHPDKLRELEAAWQLWNAGMKAPLWECDGQGRLPSRKAPLPPGVLFTHQASVVLEHGQLVIESTGHDPQVGFDAVPPSPGPYTLQLRAKFAGAGLGQVFWATTPAPSFVGEQNVTFEPIHDGQARDYTLTLPVKEPAVTFLRLDPGSSPGETRLERLVLKDANGRVLKAWIGTPPPEAPKPAEAAKPGRIETAAYYFPAVARRSDQRDPRGPRVLFIEAWNEWTEGSYLDPEAINGMQYLEAVRDVFGTTLTTRNEP